MRGSGHRSPPTPARAPGRETKDELFRAGRWPHLPPYLGRSPAWSDRGPCDNFTPLASCFQASPSLTTVSCCSSFIQPHPSPSTSSCSCISNISPESDRSSQHLSSLLFLLSKKKTTALSPPILSWVHRSWVWVPLPRLKLPTSRSPTTSTLPPATQLSPLLTRPVSSFGGSFFLKSPPWEGGEGKVSFLVLCLHQILFLLSPWLASAHLLTSTRWRPQSSDLRPLIYLYWPPVTCSGPWH